VNLSDGRQRAPGGGIDFPRPSELSRWGRINQDRLMNLYGAVELGGTKTLVTTGNGDGELGETVRLETGDKPGPVVDAIVKILAPHELSSIGIASFGPLELRPGHPDFGSILATPKPGWAGFNLVDAIGDRLGLPVALDTDVNGAALAEGIWGQSRGLDHHAYITVGTGVGAGIVISGGVLRGLAHPEFGHIAVARHPRDDFDGGCPYHRSCLEGMAAGPSLEARFGARASRLGPAETDEAVAFSAFYLAQAIRTLIYTVSPQRVVVGGGVSRLPGFHAAVRALLADQLSGYGVLQEHSAEGFIAAPGLGDRSGLMGGIALAARLVG
jgi:fructokinase